MLGQWCRNFLQMLLFPPHLIPFSFPFHYVQWSPLKELNLAAYGFLFGEDARLRQFIENPVSYPGWSRWRREHQIVQYS